MNRRMNRRRFLNAVLATSATSVLFREGCLGEKIQRCIRYGWLVCLSSYRSPSEASTYYNDSDLTKASLRFIRRFATAKTLPHRYNLFVGPA